MAVRVSPSVTKRQVLQFCRIGRRGDIRWKGWSSSLKLLRLIDLLLSLILWCCSILHTKSLLNCQKSQDLTLTSELNGSCQFLRRSFSCCQGKMALLFIKQKFFPNQSNNRKSKDSSEYSFANNFHRPLLTLSRKTTPLPRRLRYPLRLRLRPRIATLLQHIPQSI